MRVIYRKLTTKSIGRNDLDGKMLKGFTKAVMITSSNEHTIFNSHPCFQKHWAFVHFEEEERLGGTVENNNYPCKLLGLKSTASLIYIGHIKSV